MKGSVDVIIKLVKISRAVEGFVGAGRNEVSQVRF